MPPSETPQPLISVIVPAFLVDTELRRCVDSIRLAAGGPDVCEIILVMPSRQLPAAQALLPEEKAIGESRPSIYAAMNDGIAASTGRYLYFLGKDDIVLAPFRDMLSVLKELQPTAMFCDVYWGAAGIVTGRPSRLRVLARNLCHQGIVYSRASLIRHGPYFRKMAVEADKLLNVKLLWDRDRSQRLHYLPVPIAWYSASGFSTVTPDPVFRALYPAVLKRYVGGWAALLLIAVRRLRGR